MRKGLIVVGALAVILGLAALASGLVSRSLIFVFWGAVLILSLIFERVTYKRLASKGPGPGWQRTTERFVDDQTGETVTVYVQPETGERAYVVE